MTDVDSSLASDLPVAPPADAPIEVDRLRRNVRAGLFGGPVDPTRIGRFRLLQCIGRGGMGVVWSAHDDELDRTVAIKLLRPELSGRALTQEARALAKLSHPNVVSVFDVGEHEGQRFFAMEFVEGETLRAWLGRPRGLKEILAVFVAAGQGLCAAHAVGLVHRDFKPDNVLVGQDGRPRVLDFGLARPPDAGAADEPPGLDADADPFATTVNHAGLLLGTPAYMAPEQHLGDPADARSDQFAFAVALYEGLTGTLPFKGDDLRTLSLAVVRGRVVSPPGGSIPAGLWAVLVRALAVDPDARFPNTEALLAALGEAEHDTSPKLDTRQVDAVLGRAAELQAAASGRPGLSVAEVAAVAVEAGIDAAHAQQAASEVLVPRDREQGLVVPEFAYEISIVRACGHMPPAVAKLLVREMERREGVGQTEQMGASTTWQNRSMELYVHPVGGQTRLVLTRKLGVLARTRPWAYGLVGIGLAVGSFIPLVVSLFPAADGEMALIVFATIFAGALLGRRFASRMHDRALDRERSSLQATADRLTELAQANP